MAAKLDCDATTLTMIRQRNFSDFNPSNEKSSSVPSSINTRWKSKEISIVTATESEVSSASVLPRRFHDSRQPNERWADRDSFRVSKAMSNSQYSNVGSERDPRDGCPPIILFGSEQQLSSATSSITESDFSSHPMTPRTEDYLDWSDVEATGSPPKVIKVCNSHEGRQHLHPTTLPYAQLCFDPKQQTLVTLLEINLAGDGSRSKRLRILDLPYPNGTGETISNDESPSLFLVTSTQSSESDWTIGANSLDLDTTEHKKQTTAIRSHDMWFDEADVEMYLLHECDNDLGNGQAPRYESGCTASLKRLFVSSCSCLASKKRDRDRMGHASSLKDSFSSIGYEFLESASV